MAAAAQPEEAREANEVWRRRSGIVPQKVKTPNDQTHIHLFYFSAFCGKASTTH